MGYGAFYVICPRASSQYVMPLPNPVDPDPLKYVGGSEYVLTHSFIQNCCWITLHVLHHEE